MLYLGRYKILLSYGCSTLGSQRHCEFNHPFKICHAKQEDLMHAEYGTLLLFVRMSKEC